MLRKQEGHRCSNMPITNNDHGGRIDLFRESKVKRWQREERESTFLLLLLPLHGLMDRSFACPLM